MQPADPPLRIREEAAGDTAVISELIDTAFAGNPHSDGSEAALVARLRDHGALSLSLVAERAGTIAGHAAFSPVTIDGAELGWVGLGPVAVAPDAQRGGIGAALIRAGLDRLRKWRTTGCVVLGDPAYYSRFGFAPDPAMTYPGSPPVYFQALVLAGPAVHGTVAYHPAFGGAD